MTSAAWPIEVRRGRAGELHALALPEPIRPMVWSCELERPALVLGSTQRDEVVDRAAAARAGVDVARRRSGGGAVLLVPGEMTWVDVLVPVGHPRWSDDVGRSSWWVGEAWAGALADLGVGDVHVHRGPLERGPWSSLVCFAGMGPGEVRAAGRKVVGISQRRTRAGARFQCLLLHRWDPGALLEVLALDEEARREARAALAGAAGGIGAVQPSAEVVRAFAARLGEVAEG